MITAEAAKNLGMEEDDVRKVIDEVMLLLHKGSPNINAKGGRTTLGARFIMK